MYSPENSSNPDRRAFLKGAGIAAVAGIGGAVAPRSVRAAVTGRSCLASRTGPYATACDSSSQCLMSVPGPQRDDLPPPCRDARRAFRDHP